MSFKCALQTNFPNIKKQTSIAQRSKKLILRTCLFLIIITTNLNHAFANNTPKINNLEDGILKDNMLSKNELSRVLKVGPSAEKSDINIMPYLYFWQDTLGTSDIYEVNQTPNSIWQANRNQLLKFGKISKVYWFKVEIEVGQIKQENWVLNIIGSRPENIKLYTLNAEDIEYHGNLGTRVPFSQWPLQHQNMGFPFKLNADSSTTLYIKNSSPNIQAMSFNISSTQTFMEKAQSATMLNALYFGIIIALACYNFFIFMSTKDISYWYYTLFISFAGLSLFAFNGFGAVYFWPNSVWSQINVPYLFLLINVWGGCKFAIHFLDIKSMSKHFYLFFECIALACIACVTPFVLNQFSAAQLAASLLLGLGSIAFIFAGILAWKNGKTYAKHYVIAWSVYCVAVTIASLGSLTVIAYESWMKDLVQLASALEAMLISFALAARIKTLKEGKQIAEAETKAKSAFLAKMSHEIRTPMSGVLGMSELLSDRLKDATNIHYNDIIHASGSALLTIINDILDYSKIEAGKMEIESIPLDLEKTICDAIDLIKLKAAEKQIEVFAKIDPRLPDFIKSDPARIKQIILNFTSNAIKFTKKGQIIIEAEVHPDNPKLLKISVIDTGEGIAYEDQNKLFQAFSQANTSVARTHGGTGLGLAISKQLAELMGGEVGFQSKPGYGSNFWFTIQVAEAKNHVPIQALLSLKGYKILIVDDNIDFAELQKNQSEKWGMHTELAYNGKQALEALLIAAQDDDPFDLVCFDLNMPIMDGLSACQEMEQNPILSPIPRILLTSAVTLPNKEKLKQAGICLALEKPSIASALFDAYAMVLGFKKQEKVKVLDSYEDLTSLNILIAEDNKVNQLVIRGMLEKLHQNTNFVANGEELVDEFHEHREDFDIILMDCEMPVMDGFEATEVIRAEESDSQNKVPIIALTAHVMRDQRDKCLMAGMDAYLAKPIDFNALKSIINQYKHLQHERVQRSGS